jgi:ATP-dependent RNA helicase DDX35
VDTFLRFFRIKKKRKFTETKADFHLKDVVAISVEGRQFSVDIQYLNEPASNYLEKTIETTLAIDAKEGPV